MSLEKKSPTGTINFPTREIILWSKYVRDLRRVNRYILDKDVQYFIEKIIEYSEMRRTAHLKKGELLYRARLHSSLAQNEDCPFSPEDMKAPPVEKATAGRLNPEGIPYLYLASDESTAVAEVRPWKNASITVGQLELKRDLTVVDGTEDVIPELVPEEAEAWEENAKTTWQTISYMFSMPHHPDEKVGYAPTQYLAELYKMKGFHGIKYPSALGPKGFNVVLFNSDDAEVLETNCVKVIGVDYDYRAK